MLRMQEQTKLSMYGGLYDIVVPDEHLLRKVKENIDFSFVNPMLKQSYCEHFGRPAKEPERMFKAMFIKKLYDLSDETLVRDIRVNMAYKYFLDMNPEDDVFDSSLLTKFRKLRITEDILEEMLKETIRQAIEKGLIRSTAILVDATHTSSNAHMRTATQILRNLSKELRKEIYRTMYDTATKFPERPSETADLTEEIEYTKQLLENIGGDVEEMSGEKARKLYAQIQELLESGRIREIRSTVDEDARVGHKSQAHAFFGYKNHLAMTEDRLITGIKVTSGEASDGRQLQELIEQSQANGVGVTEVLGDMAYSGRENIDYCKEKEIALIARSNPVIATAAAPKEDGFIYNKDADMMQCPAGELAMRVSKAVGKHDNHVVSYHFSKSKCKKCPRLSQCKVGLSKTKSYNLTLLNDRNREHLAFQQTDYFRTRSRQRYKVEQKNAELKCAHGLARADSMGLVAMRLQAYFTAFVANLKRIVRLSEVGVV